MHAWIMAGTSVVRVTPPWESASTTSAGEKSSWITMEVPAAMLPMAVSAAAAW